MKEFEFLALYDSVVWARQMKTSSTLIAMNAPPGSIRYSQREITLRDSLQKFITLHKARSVYLWGWCRMLVEIELLPWGWPHGVPSMPKNLKKVQTYPNPVNTLLEVNSSTLHNLHYIVLVLCKAARPAQKKRENRNFGAVIRLFVSYIFGSTARDFTIR